MSSRFLEPAALLLLLLAAGAASAAPPALRVCADPDNLPYSQRDESGFENQIARLVAHDMGAALSYFWQEQGRGFVRKTMGAGQCDVIIGVPVGFDKVLPTRPYYRSTYVAVSRADAPPFRGFDPAALQKRRIGVQLIGNDMAASPPGHALVRAGAVANVTGFPVYGEVPAARRMIDALDAGQIDLALLWGPQAGYFARHARLPMRVDLARAPAGLPVPFEFAIAMGVRKGDTALRDRLDEILRRRRPEIDAILAQYQVPRADLPGAETGGGRP
jgi:quinoprotein dehydrogenase-associated probable ABC transporter substrate-binding protein